MKPEEIIDKALYPFTPMGWAEAARIRAQVLTALDSAGYVVVPREPTEAMIDAYFDRLHALGFHAGMNATAAWSAMIDAAKGGRDE